MFNIYCKIPDKETSFKDHVIKEFEEISEDSQKGEHKQNTKIVVVVNKDMREVIKLVKKGDTVIECSATQDAQESGLYEDIAKRYGIKKEDLKFTSPSMVAAKGSVDSSKEDAKDKKSENFQMLKKSIQKSMKSKNKEHVDFLKKSVAKLFKEDGDSPKSCAPQAIPLNMNQEQIDREVCWVLSRIDDLRKYRYLVENLVEENKDLEETKDVLNREYARLQKEIKKLLSKKPDKLTKSVVSLDGAKAMINEEERKKNLSKIIMQKFGTNTKPRVELHQKLGKECSGDAKPLLRLVKSSMEKSVPKGVDKDKYESCVLAVKDQGKKYNPYAVCTSSMKKADEKEPRSLTEARTKLREESKPNKEIEQSIINKLKIKSGAGKTVKTLEQRVRERYGLDKADDITGEKKTTEPRTLDYSIINKQHTKFTPKWKEKLKAKRSSEHVDTHAKVQDVKRYAKEIGIREPDVAPSSVPAIDVIESRQGKKVNKSDTLKKAGEMVDFAMAEGSAAPVNPSGMIKSDKNALNKNINIAALVKKSLLMKKSFKPTMSE